MLPELPVASDDFAFFGQQDIHMPMLAVIGLADRLQGAEVQGVRLGKPLRWPLGVAPARLPGRRAGALKRRGKYLWLPLALPAGADDPASEGGLLLHLGMSGSLQLSGAAGEPGAARCDTVVQAESVKPR
jgi:formamidopyrimidine-DNA glycosylase